MLQLSTTVICTCPFSIFQKPDWSPGLQDPGRRSDMLIKRSQVLQGCWRRLALDLRIIGWPWIKNCLMQWPCFKGADEYWRYPTLLENDKVSLWRSCCFLLLIATSIMRLYNSELAISPTKNSPWFFWAIEGWPWKEAWLQSVGVKRFSAKTRVKPNDFRGQELWLYYGSYPDPYSNTAREARSHALELPTHMIVKCT